MTKDQVRNYVIEEGSLSALGSNQMLAFASGVVFAMYGYEIPKEFYPLPTSYWLGKQYAGTNAEFWQIALWSGAAMVQSHREVLSAFDVEFDLWKRERILHARPIEPFATYFFVTNGVVRNTANGTRCTYCGKHMQSESICAQCYEILNMAGIDIAAWCEHTSLKIDSTSIWDGYAEFVKV